MYQWRRTCSCVRLTCQARLAAKRLQRFHTVVLFSNISSASSRCENCFRLFFSFPQQASVICCWLEILAQESHSFWNMRPRLSLALSSHLESDQQMQVASTLLGYFDSGVHFHKAFEGPLKRVSRNEKAQRRQRCLQILFKTSLKSGKLKTVAVGYYPSDLSQMTSVSLLHIWRAFV